MPRDRQALEARTQLRRRRECELVLVRDAPETFTCDKHHFKKAALVRSTALRASEVVKVGRFAPHCHVVLKFGA